MQKEYKYTYDDVLKVLAEQYGKFTTRANLSFKANKEEFWKKGWVIKKENGFKTIDGRDGKECYFNQDGFDRLVEIGLATRNRRTKKEMERNTQTEFDFNNIYKLDDDVVQLCKELKINNIDEYINNLAKIELLRAKQEIEQLRIDYTKQRDSILRRFNDGI